MIIAVQLQITMVSINTPNACVSPAFTGKSHSAAAAAHGAEPEPASFENRPLFTPFIKNCSESSRYNLSDSKCLLKDPTKYAWNTFHIYENNKNRNEEITYSHNRHDQVQNFYRRIFTKDNHCRNCNKDNRCIKRWNMKCIFKRRCN